MTTRTTPYAPGTPCWVDLFTSDPERSAAFYTAVLGWELTALGEEYGGYTLARSDGEVVAGLMRNSGDSGSPDTWSTYLATADLEGTVAKAVEAGASVLAPAMGLGTLGSMAVLVDPAGGVFGLWQAGRHTGFTKYNEPGSVTWDEHHSTDFAATSAFYAEVFGWDYEVVSDTDDFRFLVARVDDHSVAGLMDAAAYLPPEIPSHWAVYFSVADVDAVVDLAAAAGATVLQPPQDTPYGRLADLLDPTGARFNLIADLPEDDEGQARAR